MRMCKLPLKKRPAVKLEQMVCGKVVWPGHGRRISMPELDVSYAAKIISETPPYQSLTSHILHHLCQQSLVSNPQLTFVVPNKTKYVSRARRRVTAPRCYCVIGS